MSYTQTEVVYDSRLVNKSPIFYGWIILLIGTLGKIMSSPGQTYSVSIFLEYFIADLNLSRAVVSMLYGMGTLVGSFALPYIGRYIDRYGSRLMMTIIASLFGLACIYMGFISNVVMLLLGFVAIRMLGQGGLVLISQNVINQWWVRRRGMVMGISGLFMSLLGVGGFPLLIIQLIPLYGWRISYGLLGLLLLFVMAPLGFLLIRNKPEQFGLFPDGHITSDLVADNKPIAEEDWTLAEARRTPIFWVFALGLASVSMLSTGLFFHIISIFEDNGLSSTVAASAFVPIAVTTAIVNLGGGILIDRIPIRWLLSMGLFLQSTSLLMAQALSSIEMAFLYGIILGATSGLMGIINGVSWAKYFGRRHLGSITGVTATILIVGSALGPLPLGVARDILGSYNLALTTLSIIPFVLGIAAFFVKRPSK